MFRELTFLIVTSLFLAISCKGQKYASDKDKSNLPSMELIMQDNYSGSEVEEILILKDQKSLNAFFGKINRTRKPGLSIPEIDFTKEMLLIWCSGEGIEDIPELAISRKKKDTFFLSKKEKKNNIKSSALISPFTIYKLPISSKRMVLE